jgi:hypothetical protein
VTNISLVHHFLLRNLISYSFPKYCNLPPILIFCYGYICRIFGPKSDEVTGEWRKLHKEELHNLYSSPYIVRVIKSKRMRWAGHVARMGRKEACIVFWWVNPRERDHWGDPGLDGRIILGWIFRKWDVELWTGLGWLRIETGGGDL